MTGNGYRVSEQSEPNQFGLACRADAYRAVAVTSGDPTQIGEGVAESVCHYPAEMVDALGPIQTRPYHGAAVSGAASAQRVSEVIEPAGPAG